CEASPHRRTSVASATRRSGIQISVSRGVSGSAILAPPRCAICARRIASSAAIAARLRSPLADMFRFAWWTGKRRTQVAITTWAHYDEQAQTLTTETKQNEVLHLAGDAADLVARLYAERPSRCAFVFHHPMCKPGRTQAPRVRGQYRQDLRDCLPKGRV